MRIRPALAHRRVARGLLALLAGLVGLLVAACSPTATAPASGAAAAPSGGTGAGAPAGSPATQTSEGGQVTVAVTWEGRAAGPVFVVTLDTHSVDLDAVDLSQLAVLRADPGGEVRPTGWDAPKGGHHRSGTLAFPATAADGSPIIGPNTTRVELTIRDVAGVPARTFRWML